MVVMLMVVVAEGGERQRGVPDPKERSMPRGLHHCCYYTVVALILFTRFGRKQKSLSPFLGLSYSFGIVFKSWLSSPQDVVLYVSSSTTALPPLPNSRHNHHKMSIPAVPTELQAEVLQKVQEALLEGVKTKLSDQAIVDAVRTVGVRPLTAGMRCTR